MFLHNVLGFRMSTQKQNFHSLLEFMFALIHKLVHSHFWESRNDSGWMVKEKYMKKSLIAGETPSTPL